MELDTKKSDIEHSEEDVEADRSNFIPRRRINTSSVNPGAEGVSSHLIYIPENQFYDITISATTNSKVKQYFSCSTAPLDLNQETNSFDNKSNVQRGDSTSLKDSDIRYPPAPLKGKPISVDETVEVTEVNPDVRFPPNESELRRSFKTNKSSSGSEIAHDTCLTSSLATSAFCTGARQRNYAFDKTRRFHSIMPQAPRFQRDNPQAPPQQECTRMRLSSSSSSDSPSSSPPTSLNLHPDCNYTGSTSKRRYRQALVPSGWQKEARPNLKTKDSTSGKFNTFSGY